MYCPHRVGPSRSSRGRYSAAVSTVTDPTSPLGPTLRPEEVHDSTGGPSMSDAMTGLSIGPPRMSWSESNCSSTSDGDGRNGIGSWTAAAAAFSFCWPDCGSMATRHLRCLPGSKLRAARMLETLHAPATTN